MTVSLCMIVKNEENFLDACLSSAAGLFDELVIVDTGSTDRTKEIAAARGAKIYDFTWVDDFAAARNYSFSKGTMDYLMWLDADDILKPIDRERFAWMKENWDPRWDVMAMPYNVAFNETGAVTASFLRERIVRRELFQKGVRWTGAIHEALAVDEYAQQISDVEITHTGEMDGARNLAILERQLQTSPDDLRLLYQYAMQLMHQEQYDEAIELFHSFLTQGGGQTVHYVTAMRALYQCYLLKGDPEKAVSFLDRLLEQGIKTAEVCCQKADARKDAGDLDGAVRWYWEATRCPRQLIPGAMSSPLCYYYTPLFELGRLYLQKTQPELALNCFRLAAKYDDNEEVRQVVERLEGILGPCSEVTGRVTRKR